MSKMLIRDPLLHFSNSPLTPTTHKPLFLNDARHNNTSNIDSILKKDESLSATLLKFGHSYSQSSIFR